jgi:putative hydrolase of the HAD superfamily
MKPHPNIFRAALALMQVEPEASVMVGDSLSHDVYGARRVGMRGILIARGSGPTAGEGDFDIIRSLRELPGRIVASEKLQARS